MENVTKSVWAGYQKNGSHWSVERSNALAEHCNETVGNNIAQKVFEAGICFEEKGEYHQSKKDEESKVE